MDMIAAIEVQMITNFLPHQKRKFKSRTSEYFFKDMTHTQFKRTFRFSMEGVRYCQSEGQAELDFYSVLRAPAQPSTIKESIKDILSCPELFLSFNESDFSVST